MPEGFTVYTQLPLYILMLLFTTTFVASFINLCLLVSLCLRVSVNLIKHDWKLIVFAMMFYIVVMRITWYLNVVAYDFILYH